MACISLFLDKTGQILSTIVIANAVQTVLSFQAYLISAKIMPKFLKRCCYVAMVFDDLLCLK